MKDLIRQEAEYQNYELTDWDIEQIIDRYFHLLHKDGQVNRAGIASAVRFYVA